MNAQVKPCCQDPTNLRPAQTDRADLACNVCLVCECRHFRLYVDPGKFLARGNALGR